MKSNRRGQNLMMLSLTCLIMTLMVMMTVSIGMKAKEKMELQTLSDSSAYSQAVVTARTFNALSAMNRVAVAHMTAVTAVQSLVSWGTYARATWNTIGDHWQDWEDDLEDIVQSWIYPGGCKSHGGGVPCKKGVCNGPGCSLCDTWYHAVKGFNSLLKMFNMVSDNLLRILDVMAWLEAIGYLYAGDWIHLAGQLPTYLTLRNFMNNQNGVDKLVAKARPGTQWSELSTPHDVDGTNFDETLVPGSGAVLPINPIYYHHEFAANGSRLHPFLTNRTAASGTLNTVIPTLIPPLLASHRQQARGSGYIASQPGPQHGTNMFSMLFGLQTFFSADDHTQGGGLQSRFTWDFNTCIFMTKRSRRTGVDAELWSNQAFGMHRSSNFTCFLPHAIGGMGRGYPWFLDYNPVLLANQGNIWGQPKNFNMVTRDYTKRPFGAADQMNPFFRFSFSGSSGGSTYDQRGWRTKSGSDISKQIGFSTGVTYYHRGNNFFGYHSGVEPPNFFNPFWRAGLTRLDVDNNLGDVSSTLGSYPAAVDAFNGLRGAGFTGWQ